MPSRKMNGTSRTGGLAPWIGGFLVFLFSLVTLILVNFGVGTFRVKDQPLPEYATWTGIATLERKIQILEEFAAQGPVDAIIVGASISDHGISAEVLSRNLSAAYNRPFRVFNLSTGGAEATTLLLLYRLARIFAKPKQIWIAYPVEQNIGDDISKNSPDYALWHAPAGSTLHHPSLLPFSYQLYQISLIRHAAALRDLLFYGSYANRPLSLLDAYEINSSGDSRGFLYCARAESISKYADLRRELVLSLAHQYAATSEKSAKLAVYFSRSALETLTELRSLATRENCSLKVLAVDSVAGLITQDEEYLAASDVFYKSLSRLLDAPVIDVLASFTLAGYKWADPSHLNSNGADELSSLIAANIANRPLPKLPCYEATLEVRYGKPISNLTPFTAVILQHPSDPIAALHLRYLQNPGVAQLRPGRQVQVVCLLPDNSTVVLPAVLKSGGAVLVNTSALPPSIYGRVLLIQLTSIGAKWGKGMNQPLASYRWSSQTLFQKDFEGVSARIFTTKTSYKSFEPITVNWKDVDSPTPKDWVGIFPVGGDEATRLFMKWTGGGKSGKVEIPGNLTAKAGKYEVRLYENDGWNLITSSKPFTILSLSASLSVSSKAVSRGRFVQVFWSDLEHASKDDWIGLFPQGGANTSRLDFKFTGGNMSGTMDIPIPLNIPPGLYEVRFYTAGSWNLLATSDSFSILATTIRVVSDRLLAQAGGVIKVKWHGVDTPKKNDWIGFFPKGWKENIRKVYQQTGGLSSGELNFILPLDTAAGDYEFRFYANDSWQLMATSDPVRIEVKPANRNNEFPSTGQ